MKNFSKILIKIISYLCVCCTLFTIFAQCNVTNFVFADEDCLTNQTNPIKTIINWLFPIKQNEVASKNTAEVYVGGVPLGFALKCDGVVIVGVSDILTNRGVVSPSGAAGITSGDILLEIEDEKITSAEKIEEIINRKDNENRSLKVKVKRSNKVFTTFVLPEIDELTKTYKMGLWIRDDAAGVGTLSFIRSDNLRFGALGHPVCDIDTGVMLPVMKGEIYSCDIIGVTKGNRGTPGELKGIFLKGGQVLGELDNNTNFGVFGKINEEVLDELNLEKMPTASPNEIVLGKAKLRCSISGNKPQDYSIEIIKTNQNSDSKNMIIRITDQRLIEKTGGIVQGMSGSPIIQNGKVVGAVTHVFVSDPIKGFATFISNMIDL
ncbi:MAG: SpoIVB peptidase [bacterium]|nr:SpoIVB peptidase [bacterium]